MWPIYFREVRGNHGAVRSCRHEGLAGSVHSWGWAVSEVSCLSGGGYGRGHNERHLGAGDGVAVGGGGGAKPSPASEVREEHQLYYLLYSVIKVCQLAKYAKSGDDILKFEEICMCVGQNLKKTIKLFLSRPLTGLIVKLRLVVRKLLFSFSIVFSQTVTGTIFKRAGLSQVYITF